MYTTSPTSQSDANRTDEENCTTDATDMWHSATVVNELPWQLVFCALYGALAVLSLTGNSVVVYVVFTSRELRATAINLLIANLAASDLVTTMTSLWLTPLFTLLGPVWRFGETLCYVAAVGTSPGMLISSFTLATIAVDRYVLIVHPFRRNIPRWLCIALITLMWTLAIAAILPVYWHTTYITVPSRCNGTHYKFCQESRWDPPRRIGYGAVILMLRSVFPLSLIAYCYTSIARHLRQIESRLKGRKSSLRDIDELHRKQSLQRVLVSMVVAYALCSLPLDLLNLYQDIDWALKTGFGPLQDYVEIVKLFAHVAAMTATLWNPLLYAFCNENFKRELPWRFLHSRRTYLAVVPKYRKKSNDPSFSPDCATAHPSSEQAAGKEKEHLLMLSSDQETESLLRRMSYDTRNTALTCPSHNDLEDEVIL